MIRVFDGDVEVCWKLELEADEARPPFYPKDVPYLPTLSAALSWDDEVGLEVRWTLPATKARIGEMVQGLKKLGLESAPRELMEMAKRLMAAPSSERKKVFESLEDDRVNPVAAWAKAAFGDVRSAGLPDDAAAAVDRIRSFLEESGWEVLDPGPSEGPSRRVRMGKDSEVRDVYALSLTGITMVGLSEVRVPDGGVPSPGAAPS